MLKKISLKYLHQKNVMSKILPLSKVEKMSAKSIQRIGKEFNSEYWEIYLEDLLYKWKEENVVYTESFIKKYLRLAKKLNVKEDIKFLEELKSLERREFSIRRAFKTIEVPFQQGLTSDMQHSALFAYKNISLYNAKRWWMNNVFTGEMYITKSEIVFYNKKKSIIYRVIKLSEIVEIINKTFALELRLANKEKLDIRYHDNYVIYISLKRIVPKVITVEENALSYKSLTETLEQTAEIVLLDTDEK